MTFGLGDRVRFRPNDNPALLLCGIVKILPASSNNAPIGIEPDIDGKNVQLATVLWASPANVELIAVASDLVPKEQAAVCAAVDDAKINAQIALEAAANVTALQQKLARAKALLADATAKAKLAAATAATAAGAARAAVDQRAKSAADDAAAKVSADATSVKAVIDGLVAAAQGAADAAAKAQGDS